MARRTFIKRTCDHCGNKIPDGTGIVTHDVPYEGQSVITILPTGNYFDVGGQNYCDLDCLVAAISDALHAAQIAKAGEVGRG